MDARYKDLHAHPQGPGDACPMALQIVNDERQNDGSLRGKVISITGCSSGLGIETARALLPSPAQRSFSQPATSPKDRMLWATSSPTTYPSQLHLLQLDLGSLSRVRSCVDALECQSGKLNGLVTDASVRFVPRGQTQDGFDTNLGTKHIAGSLLFELLRPILHASTTRKLQSRVVIVYSTAHRRAKISVHPGDIRTRWQRPKSGPISTSMYMQSPAQCAATRGASLERCQFSEPAKQEHTDFDPEHTPWTYDVEDTWRLYDISPKLVDMSG
ncbi:NAD(P)-binding protein [Xylariaceae sp. FL0016]|nr:NAD(P)-binding protein [Xylariaceae sp. FL0016]